MYIPYGGVVGVGGVMMMYTIHIQIYTVLSLI